MMRNQWKWFVALVGVGVGAIACSDYAVVPPTQRTDELYWAVKVDHPAVLLSIAAPTNTLELHATPYTVHGLELVIDTLATPVRVSWESSDTSAVHVSQTGVLTARKLATRVNVYATLRVGDILHRDTVWVAVTEAAPSALESFSILVPSQENVVPAGGTLSLEAHAQLEDGNTLFEFPVRYYVDNPSIATFKTSTGLLYGIEPEDSVTVTAVTTVYGETRYDSLFLYTGWPIRQFSSVFTIKAQAAPNNTIVYVPKIVDLKGAPGSTYSWANESGFAPANSLGASYAGGMKFDIIFDHPEVAEAFLPILPPTSPFGQSGNILQVAFDTTGADGILSAFRKFTQIGEHYYTVQPLGVRGKISISSR